MASPTLSILPAENCRWDIVALGEVMLRLDPGEGRIATTRQFACWEGGGDPRALPLCYNLCLLRAGVTQLAECLLPKHGDGSEG